MAPITEANYQLKKKKKNDWYLNKSIVGKILFKLCCVMLIKNMSYHKLYTKE